MYVYVAFMKEITAKNTRYLDSYLNRKFDRIAEMYTDNCRFMPAGFPMQIGPQGESFVTSLHQLPVALALPVAGIAAFWAKVVDLGFYKLTFKTEETLGPVGNYTACERCSYFFEDEHGKVLQTGK